MYITYKPRLKKQIYIYIYKTNTSVRTPVLKLVAKACAGDRLGNARSRFVHLNSPICMISSSAYVLSYLVLLFSLIKVQYSIVNLQTHTHKFV